MIPKTIHYCWFGGNQIPTEYLKYIESWKKYCPNYEIIRWDETNFDINQNAYIKEAYEAKKWAFVSDYARLYIIYNYGGIYLDTDVELIQPLDHLLKYDCFLGIEKGENKVATGLGFGAKKNNEIIKLMLDEYSKIHFKIGKDIYDLTPCPERNTRSLYKIGFKNNQTGIQVLGNVAILPYEYLCPYDMKGEGIVTSKTISIHHFTASWISNDQKEVNRLVETYGKNHSKLRTKIYKNEVEYLKIYSKEMNVLHFILWKLRKNIVQKYIPRNNQNLK